MGVEGGHSMCQGHERGHGAEPMALSNVSREQRVGRFKTYCLQLSKAQQKTGSATEELKPCLLIPFVNLNFILMLNLDSKLSWNEKERKNKTRKVRFLSNANGWELRIMSALIASLHS